MGYDIRHKRDGMFELANYSEKQLVEFSQRSSKIKDKLNEQGLSYETATTKQKQQATLQTRKSKIAKEKFAKPCFLIDRYKIIFVSLLDLA